MPVVSRREPGEALLRLKTRLAQHVWAVVGVLALFTFFRIATLEGWDEAFYITQLTSALRDGDLALQNDLLAFPNPFEIRYRHLTWITGAGALANTFSVGPGVFHGAFAWPFLGIRDGHETHLRYAVTVSSMLALVLTVLTMREILTRVGLSPDLSSLASGSAVLLGPLSLYGTRAYLNAHLLSTLFATGFLLGGWLWIETGRPRHGALTGLAAGALAITRWQDAAVVAVALPAFGAFLWRSPPPARRRLLGGAAALAGAATPVLIQLYAWRAQFGSAFLIPQGPDYMRWTQPQILSVLVSPFHGLLPWMPGFALGLSGVLLAWRRARGGTRRLFLAGLAIAVPLMIYLSACPRDWWGGHSYGPRRLTSLTPLAALGLGRILERWSLRARILLLAPLALWSFFTLTAQFSGYDDLSVLFRGMPSASNPQSLEAYAGAKWIDKPWTLPRVLRPGFTFRDKPGNRDRVLGALFVAAFALGAATLWRHLRARPRLQHALLATIGLWLLVCVGRIVTLPGNKGWNGVWRDVVFERRPRPLPGGLPRGFEDAAHLVWAVAAAHAGRVEEFHAEMAKVTRLQEYGIAPEVVDAFAADPRHAWLIERPIPWEAEPAGPAQGGHVRPTGAPPPAPP